LDIQKNHSLSGEEIQNLPQMFRALPYGLGGLVMKDRDINCQMQSTKATPLLYHITLPKRPILSSDQHSTMTNKDSTTSGFILANKSFDNIANRLLQINSEVLADITERMMKGER